MQINPVSYSCNAIRLPFKGEMPAATSNAPKKTWFGWDKDQRWAELEKQCQDEIQSTSKIKRIFTDSSDQIKEAYKNKFILECNMAGFLERYKEGFRSIEAPELDTETCIDLDEDDEGNKSEETNKETITHYEYVPEIRPEPKEIKITWDSSKTQRENLDALQKAFDSLR